MMELKDLNHLLDSALNLQKKQRRRTVFVVLLIALIGVALFFTSNLFTAKTVSDKIQSDSSTSNVVYKNVIKKQNEDISTIIESYFTFRVLKNSEETSSFYATDSTFEYFFSYTNNQNNLVLSKKEVEKIDKIDFKKEQNRAFDFNDIISIATDPTSPNNTIVFAIGKQFTGSKMEDSIVEIKLNSKTKKIFSIRSYLAVNRGK